VLEDLDTLEVAHEILPGDPMYAYPGARDLYFVAGPSALRSIRLAMLAVELEVEDVGSILDFACGAGRVLRTLAAAFPEADLTACDAWAEGVKFCEETFGARGVLGGDPADLKLGGPFDVVWCGSLLTHVDSEYFVEFLKLFESVLAPGGVMVVTTRGRHVAEGLRSRESPLTLSEAQIVQVLRDYDASGFGYYPTCTPTHGDCVATRSWVCEQLDSVPALRLVLYHERAWLNAQDVVACAKP
jgi:SAM-dependent methyltransferase